MSPSFFTYWHDLSNLILSKAEISSSEFDIKRANFLKGCIVVMQEQADIYACTAQDSVYNFTLAEARLDYDVSRVLTSPLNEVSNSKILKSYYHNNATNKDTDLGQYLISLEVEIANYLKSVDSSRLDILDNSLKENIVPCLEEGPSEQKGLEGRSEQKGLEGRSEHKALRRSELKENFVPYEEEDLFFEQDTIEAADLPETYSSFNPGIYADQEYLEEE